MCLKSVALTPGVISVFICGDKGHIKLVEIILVLWTSAFSRNLKKCFLHHYFHEIILVLFKRVLERKIIPINFWLTSKLLEKVNWP